MPMTCEACGGRSRTMRANGDFAVCSYCGTRTPIARPPLMVITGAAGSGKSTLCQRLAQDVDDVVAIDVDIFDGEMASVVSPRHDYEAFWRSLMRLAHEIGQNGLPVVYCGVMLPEQVLANTDMLPYFGTVRFLGLVCDDDTLRERIRGRQGGDDVAHRIGFHVDFNSKIREAAIRPDLTLLDAAAPREVIQAHASAWIRSVLASP